MELTLWSREVGAKLTDKQLDPEEVLRGTLIPVPIAHRPNKTPIAVEWPDLFYKEPETVFQLEIGGQMVYPHTATLNLVAPSDSGPLKFAICSDAATAEFELLYNVAVLDDDDIYLPSHLTTGVQPILTNGTPATKPSLVRSLTTLKLLGNRCQAFSRLAGRWRHAPTGAARLESTRGGQTLISK